MNRPPSTLTWAFIIGGITLLSVLALTEEPLPAEKPKPEPYTIQAWENPVAGDLSGQSQCVATRLPYKDPDGRKYTSWRISCEED